MVSGENGPLGLNAPYPAPMEPSIEHVPVLDHSTRDRIVQETTEKQQIAFQKSVQVSLRSTSENNKWFNNHNYYFFIYVAGIFPLKLTVCGMDGCSGVNAPCLVVMEPETVPVHAKVHIIKEKNAMDRRMKPSLVTPFPVQVDTFDQQKKFLKIKLTKKRRCMVYRL